MDYDLIVKDVTIIHKNGTISGKTNIYIKNGRIEKVGPTEEGCATETVAGDGLFATPGFVNLHAHSPMNIFKGIAEDVTIEDWFNREIFPYESRLTGEDAYWGASLAIAEMIDNGVTAFADHYFFADQISAAVLDAGIRGDIAATIFGIAADFQTQLAAAAAVIERRNGQSVRLNLRMGPHAPYTCPPDRLRVIIRSAQQLDVGIHIHVSETKQQVDESIRSFSKTPLALLSECGGMELPTIIGHGLWLRDEELSFLNARTYLAVCPKTYLKLGMGFGILWEKYKDLPLAIGTDGAASSNTLSPMEQARLFGLAGKFICNQPEEYTLTGIWRMLMRGHDALNFQTGEIAAGYKADLLLWDLNQTNTAPVYNPLAAIIYSADSRNIIHSLVEGKFVKRCGQVQMDTAYILKQVSRIQERLLQYGKGAAKQQY